MDHLGILLRQLGKGSSLEQLKLHRTKCSRLISDVISPSLVQEIVHDIGDAKYCMIVDESTDASSIKFLAFCVSYFSISKNKMVTDFLGIAPVREVTAEALYSEFTNFLKSIKLPLKNLTSLGTDGAANLCGKNHSLFTLLRDRDLPQLLLMKCICHSVDKCSSKACAEIPCSLEFLIRESKNWFAHSYSRKETYADLYKVRNLKN